ncbi:MAG: hypothetical protein AAGH88_04160 [Planctomycetota bacterium]
MKLLIPFIAATCFAFAGVGCKSSSCCGTCGGDHGHSHPEGECCGEGGECCKKPEDE